MKRDSSNSLVLRPQFPENLAQDAEPGRGVVRREMHAPDHAADAVRLRAGRFGAQIFAGDSKNTRPSGKQVNSIDPPL